jgi:hypothetical protein
VGQSKGFGNQKIHNMGSEFSTHAKPAGASGHQEKADDAGVHGRSPAADEPGADGWGARSAPVRLIPTPGTLRAEAAGQQRVVGEHLMGDQAAHGANAQERSSTVDSSTGRSSLKHSRPALHHQNIALLMAADVQVCFGAPRA